MRSASSVMVMALLLAAVGISASRWDAGRVAKSGRAQEQRPLCNECFICDRSGDPRCLCEDHVPQCHEGCHQCEKVDTRSGTTMYQCRSFEYYDCANEGNIAAVGLPASRPDAEVAGRLAKSGRAHGQQPLCNDCFACARSANSLCICGDLVPQCHEGCQQCEKVDTLSGKPLYQCRSFEDYQCANEGRLAAVGLPASRPGAGTQTWPPVEGRPSCKRCGACTRMWPPEANRCVCDDIVPQCHEGCSKCEKVDTRSGKPLYQCQSFEYYNCAADGQRAAVGLPAADAVAWAI